MINKQEKEKKMKTYEVQMQGLVNHSHRVEATSKEDAINKAYDEVRKINLKDEIYTNFYFDTSTEEVEEIDLEEEEIMCKMYSYQSKKRKELGDKEYFKIQDKIIKEARELFGVTK